MKKKSMTLSAIIKILTVTCLLISSLNAVATVQEDIAALTERNRSAKQAASRLLRLGVRALPEVHSVMQSSDNNVQLLQLTGFICKVGTAESVTHIISMTRRHIENNTLIRHAVLCLGYLPQTAESFEYVRLLLDDSQTDPSVVKSALGYFANQNDNRGLSYARRYSAPTINSDIRFVALYVLASLGDNSQRGSIVAMLRGGAKENRQYALLLGLANITTSRGFLSSTSFMNRNTKHYSSARRVNLFNNASELTKDTHAKEMLANSYSPYEMRKSVKYLLNSSRLNVLEEALNKKKNVGNLNYIQNEIIRNGYNVDVQNNRLRILLVR